MKPKSVAVKKVLSTPLFRQRIVKAKKGKGSFKRIRKAEGVSWTLQY
jgi:stalled ribosome alternative rescue factor ArfA